MGLLCQLSLVRDVCLPRFSRPLKSRHVPEVENICNGMRKEILGADYIFKLLSVQLWHQNEDMPTVGFL
jgi:hypothetical protein